MQPYRSITEADVPEARIKHVRKASKAEDPYKKLD